MKARLAPAIAIATLAALLTSCVAAPQPRVSALPPLSATVRPTPDASTTDAGGTEGCVDGVLRLSEAPGDVAVSGSCAMVEISGVGWDVDLTRADVDALIVRGDGNDVVVGVLRSLSVEGQANDMETVSIAEVTIRGDRNTLEVDGIVDVLTIAGAGNDVEAGAVGHPDIQGDRNEVSIAD